MKFIVKGQYRADRNHEHGEPEIKNFQVTFTDSKLPTIAQARVFVEKHLRSQDSDFDSIKTLTVTQK